MDSHSKAGPSSDKITLSAFSGRGSGWHGECGAWAYNGGLDPLGLWFWTSFKGAKKEPREQGPPGFPV